MKTNQLLIIAVIAVVFAACGAGSKKSTDMEKRTQVKIETTLGNIVVELYNETPKHRDNFIKLAKEGVYDSTLFHRVIKAFMIQAGDPDSKTANDTAQLGGGDVGYTVPAEFVPKFFHKKGALAAARKGDMANPKKASSGSQFYIVHDENNCLHLDGQYTIFGEVTEGLDVIDKIATVATDRYDRPYEDVMIVSVKALNVEPETAPADSVAVQPADTTSAE
mgnify:CR=1 FL=1